MNLKKLHNLFLIGIALCSCFSYAQNIDNQEVQDLKFHQKIELNRETRKYFVKK